MRTLPVLVMACAVTQVAVAQRSRRDRDRYSAADSSTWQWHGAVTQGKALTIFSMNGSIQAKAGRGSEAVVRAVKKARRGADTSDVQIHVEKLSGGSIMVCAVFADQDLGAEECPDGDRSRRHSHYNHDDNGEVSVRFTIEVPSGVDFEARTMNGDIDADSMPANAEVTTMNGDVTLSAKGHGAATTMNGDIRVDLGRADWRESASFTTMNGNIDLALPANLNADVYATTMSGDVTSDFPLTVRGRWGPRELHGTVGNGGPELRLKTMSGDIRLRKR